MITLESHDLRALQRASERTILGELDLLIREVKDAARRSMRVETPTWEGVIQPIEEAFDRQERAWGRVHALQSVRSTPALERLVERGDRMVSSLISWYGRQRKLYHAVQAIEPSNLSIAQRRTIELYVIGFRMLGIHLPQHQQRRLAVHRRQLRSLSNRFSKNLLAATRGAIVHVVEKQRLAGVPSSVVADARQRARKRKKVGWLLSVQSPEYGRVMSTAHDRSLRRELYELSNRRASERGPASQNNWPLIRAILSQRQQFAKLLGFSSFAVQATKYKMAKHPAQALALLKRLARAANAAAKQEWRDLQSFALTREMKSVQTWDIDYVVEHWRQEKFGLEMEALRRHFPLSAVWSELEGTVREVSGLRFTPLKDYRSYDEHVRCYRVYDQENVYRGQLIVDLFVHPNKESGAWVATDTSRGMVGQQLQLPVVRLHANFPQPDVRGESWLTPDEIVTLFHEMGHAVHQLISEINIHSVSGGGGVAWDAIEIPSQWLELYGDQPSLLARVARRAKRPLSTTMLRQLYAWQTWRGGTRIIRQVRFGLFDLMVHQEQRISAPKAWQTIAATYPFPPVGPANRFPCTFRHIFDGGYAAGYYSYLWSEVYSQLVYARTVTSRSFTARFCKLVLSRGGERPAAEVYRVLVGSKPSIGPLLKSYGLQPPKAA